MATQGITIAVDWGLAATAAKFRKAADALDPQPVPVGSHGWAVLRIRLGDQPPKVVQCDIPTGDDADAVVKEWAARDPRGVYVPVQITGTVE